MLLLALCLQWLLRLLWGSWLSVLRQRRHLRCRGGHLLLCLVSSRIESIQ